MKAVNLHFLTRVRTSDGMSMLLSALSGRSDNKTISVHEAASLCSLTDLLETCLRPGSSSGAPEMYGTGWLPLLDGFFFSYTIQHIGKEFDLLKVSSDGSCILNIELKSEAVEESRIRKQLEQNRYYLAHISRTILSFTYVMETSCLYTMNDRGHLRRCDPKELAEALARPLLREYMEDGIDQLFRASDYLISPVGSPEKFLQGEYFLTNQQADFRRRILQHLQEEKKPAVAVSGTAGTGKTLLLFDLAMQLSKKHSVLFVHAGPLRNGHLVIDRRLKKVSVISGERPCPASVIREYAFLIIDEASHLPPETARHLLSEASAADIPVILAYDPHELFYEQTRSGRINAFENWISSICTLSLSFSGNIRINRPVCSFLKTLFHLKEAAGRPDYSCIDVLYAENTEDMQLISGYYCREGYVKITANDSLFQEAELIAQEYDYVLMILDEGFFYNESGYLSVRSGDTAPLKLLYEGLLRTRKKLCLLVAENRPLFLQVLSIKLHHPIISLWDTELQAKDKRKP